MWNQTTIGMTSGGVQAARSSILHNFTRMLQPDEVIE
jgi:hypothetical protein